MDYYQCLVSRSEGGIDRLMMDVLIIKHKILIDEQVIWLLDQWHKVNTSLDFSFISFFQSNKDRLCCFPVIKYWIITPHSRKIERNEIWHCHQHHINLQKIDVVMYRINLHYITLSIHKLLNNFIYNLQMRIFTHSARTLTLYIYCAIECQYINCFRTPCDC